MPFKTVTRRGQVYYVPSALPVPPEHSDAAPAGRVDPSAPAFFVASWSPVPALAAPDRALVPQEPLRSSTLTPEPSSGATRGTEPGATREHRARRRRGGG